MKKKIIINGRIKFIEPDLTQSAAIVIEDGIIRSIKKPNALIYSHYEDVEIIDAKGAIVMPGFIDAHNHFTLMGLQIAELNLAGIVNKSTVLEKIRERHQSIDPDRVLSAFNYEYDYFDAYNRISAEDLTSVAPNRMIKITDRSGHMSVTNAYSLERAGLRLTESENYGKDENATFNGELYGHTNCFLSEIFRKNMRNPTVLKLAWKHAADIAVSHGITQVHAIIPEEEMGELIGYDECLPVNLRIYGESKNVIGAKMLGLKQIGGCGKVMIDGDTGPFTAAFLEPYTVRPDTKGLLYYTDEELNEYVWEAHYEGMQIALHCVGDAASEQFLNAVEAAQKRLPKKMRHRIEHLEFPTAEQIIRAKQLGVAISIQPAFNYYWPHDFYITDLGEERAQRADPIRSLIDAGLLVGFGSDCTVTPCDPLLTVHAAVSHSRPQERITVKQALYAHTAGGAKIGNEDGIRGSITPGKTADLVFLAEDPEEVPIAEVKDIPVLRTIVCGETVYLA
ncbi:MAG: amidohydrolase [Chloroflexi bacterium]|nr:amidohydrolase [Chloroflexota bacterium]